MNKYIIILLVILQSSYANKIEDNLNLSKTNSSEKVLTTNENSEIFSINDESIKEALLKTDINTDSKQNNNIKQNSDKPKKTLYKDQSKQKEQKSNNLESYILSIYNAELKTQHKKIKNAKANVNKKSFYTLEENQNESDNENSSSNKNINEDLFVGVGYCQFENDVEVTYETTRNIVCKLQDSNIKWPELELSLIPKGDLLIGKALRLTYQKGGKLITVELDEIKSQILNQEGTSEQIATYVNDRKVDKNINIVKEQVATNMNSAVQSTYNQYKESRKEQKTQTDANGNIIVTTDNQKPDLATDLAYGLGNALFSTIDKVAKVTQEDLPYLYRIVSLSEIKVKFYKKKGNK